MPEVVGGVAAVVAVAAAVGLAVAVEFFVGAGFAVAVELFVGVAAGFAVAAAVGVAAPPPRSMPPPKPTVPTELLNAGGVIERTAPNPVTVPAAIKIAFFTLSPPVLCGTQTLRDGHVQD
jgi:hypothetical protein